MTEREDELACRERALDEKEHNHSTMLKVSNSTTEFLPFFLNERSQTIGRLT